MYNIFYSLLSLIVALFFILVGIVSVLIPWSSTIRSEIIQFILDDSLAISLFGFAFLVIGITIIANIILNSRKHHYLVRSGSSLVSVDDAVIQEYLSIYWKQLFPEQEIPWRLTFKSNKVHIDVNLPYLPKEDQKILLERIRKDISSLFHTYLSYDEEFYLTATFQAKPK